eukprot:3123061-Prymnesium_polylepis.3
MRHTCQRTDPHTHKHIPRAAAFAIVSPPQIVPQCAIHCACSSSRAALGPSPCVTPQRTDPHHTQAQSLLLHRNCTPQTHTRPSLPSRDVGRPLLLNYSCSTTRQQSRTPSAAQLFLLDNSTTERPPVSPCGYTEARALRARALFQASTASSSSTDLRLHDSDPCPSETADSVEDGPRASKGMGMAKDSLLSSPSSPSSSSSLVSSSGIQDVTRLIVLLVMRSPIETASRVVSETVSKAEAALFRQPTATAEATAPPTESTPDDA